MNPDPVLILFRDEGCRLVSCGQDPQTPIDVEDHSFGDPASLVAALLSKQAKNKPLPVVIALPASMCYAASVSTAGLPSRQLRQALAYRFEPLIPFSIEELVVDNCGSGEERFMVAAHFERLEALVRALEDAGIQIRAISPLALLAAQNLSPKIATTHPTNTPHVVKITEAFSDSVTPQFALNEITLSGNNVKAWRWNPKHATPDGDAESQARNFAATLQHACATSLAIIAEDQSPWINLQQGPLANRKKFEQVRRPLSACLAAAALLLLATIFAMQFRAWQYRDITSSHDQQAQVLYESAFPHEAVPVSMNRRLETKLREARGRQGLATDTQLFANQDTLAILNDLLARLPSDLRLIITDLRINDNRIDLSGQTRSHSDADTLAQALRADGQFLVTPPSTENLSGQGVQFTLNLTHPPRNPGSPSEDQPGAVVVYTQEADVMNESAVRTPQESTHEEQGGTP